MGWSAPAYEMRARTSVSRTCTPICKLGKVVVGASFVDQKLVERLAAPPARRRVAEALELRPRLQRPGGQHAAGAARVLGADVAAQRAVLERVVEADPLEEGELATSSASRSAVILGSVKLVSVPVGQNRALRVPLGVANTTNRVGAGVGRLAIGARRLQQRDRGRRRQPAPEEIPSGEAKGIHCSHLSVTARIGRPIPKGVRLGHATTSSTRSPPDFVKVSCSVVIEQASGDCSLRPAA